MRRLIGTMAAVALAAGALACARSDADATITTKVKSKLESDRMVTNPEKIQVQTQKKVVTLTGRVESPAVEQQAVKLARSTEGVKNVVDNLSVTPASAPPSSSGAPAGPDSSSAKSPGSGAANETQPTPSARS